MQIQAEANLSALIESTDALISSVDLEDRLVTFNGAFCHHFEATFGIQPTVGMVPSDMLPPEQAILIRSLFERARTKGSFRVEFPLDDGRTLDLALNPIFVDGKLTGASVFGKDITTQKAAELALREAERKYRDIFDNALEGMFQTSPAGEPLAVNPAMAKMLGYESRAEFLSKVRNLGQDVWADRDQRALCLRQVEEHGAVLGFECQFKRKDKTLIQVSVNARRVCQANGQLRHYEGFVIDITERKQAELDHQEGLNTLREAELVGALGSYVLDIPTGTWTSSDGLNEFFGIGKEYVRDVAGWTVLVHPDDRKQMTAYLTEEVLGKAKPFDREYRILRQTDGSEHWVHGMGRLDFDAQGKPRKMRGIIKDITDHKQAEIQLRDSEERYRVAFQTSLDCVNINRLDDGAYIEVNRAFVELIGYKRHELIGHSSLELDIWADPRDRRKLVEELRRNSVVRNLEAQFRRKNGTLLWGLMSASVIELNGLPCVLSVTRDITEAKAAEARLAAAAAALRLSEERYRTVFQTCPDSVQISRMRDGAILDMNQAFLDIAGFQRDEVIGRTSQQLGIWVDDSDRAQMIDALKRGESVRDVEIRSKRKNGEIYWIRLSASQIEIDGEPCRLTFAREISEVKAAEERLASANDALRTSEERYRTVFHTSLDCIALTHLNDGEFIDVNKAFLDLIGLEHDEIIGRTSTELGIWAHPEARAEFVEILRSNSTVRDFQSEFVKKCGEKFSVLISAAIIEMGAIPCLVTVIRDISSVKAAESTIQSLALYDPLTGLPNRRLLFERLGQTLTDTPANGRLKALLLIDVDNLKTINDTLGHRTGDLLLQEVARRTTACAHDADTVGRLGGDEFVVILDDLSHVPEEAAAEAKDAGEKILASICQPFSLDGRECLSASSMGITVFGEQKKTAEDILQQADIALHMAKTAGRKTLRFFAPALQAAVNARASLEDGLRQAIKSNQFLLYYQPQIERGRLAGAEALIRWNHPQRGIVQPGEFIPLAEESHLILPLGDWVLETACKQIAAWAKRPEAAHLTVSVNISALQFRKQEFVEQVLATLARTGANPKCLKLELTESMLVENFEDVIAKMTELKSHGLSFALDDFGTGYSSLAYLKRLPLDQLKIDRAFVRDILVDITSGAIAQTILSLGRAMGLSVVAEGVETEEQRGFLAGLGCHNFQGYLFSRPLPLDEFQALL